MMQRQPMHNRRHYCGQYCFRSCTTEIRNLDAIRWISAVNGWPIIRSEQYQRQASGRADIKRMGIGVNEAESEVFSKAAPAMQMMATAAP